MRTTSGEKENPRGNNKAEATCNWTSFNTSGLPEREGEREGEGGRDGGRDGGMQRWREREGGMQRWREREGDREREIEREREGGREREREMEGKKEREGGREGERGEREYNIVTDSNVLCKETFIWNNVPCDKLGKLLPIGGAAYTCNYTTSP